ncbi:phasin family protein [Microvirga sp. VF16]|uniref:phasin family protein n=1 Tax=Microvirga sp. VF16 TaxID=2807101 RepID=UPI00193EA0A6|nr:phasin family protein [Microvirga sp. VF16]QRM32505.1 phasin family protein [Microvirga sp. VF16]
MMTINRSIGQTPPDKANEIFTQLLATSNDAAETREQLLTSLAQELDLLANLQEQHLFPVLENHPETAELVRGARDDNRQTRALLDELAAAPKDSDEFQVKVAELRRVFQQHIRNDRNELLPVVLKVLNQDEVEAVVEKVEEEIAEAEAMRTASEPRRTRRGRKQATAVPDDDETLLTVIEEAPETAQDVGQEVQETVQANLHAASQVVDSATAMSKDQNRGARTWLDQASQYVQAVAQSNRILARGAGTITLEWFGLRQERLLKNIEDGIDLLACRSMPDLVRLQSALVRHNVERMIDNGQRLAQLTAQVAQEATRTITGQPEHDRRTR